MNLYYNYQSIFDKTKATKKYYLISKYLMNEIKKDYNYKEIIHFLDDKKLFENDQNKNKRLFTIINNFQRDDILKKMLIDSNKDKQKYCIEVAEPNIIPVNYFDKETNIMIYDNFELIEEDTIKLFLDNISNLKSYYFECSYIEGKIIIYYPYNFNGSKKYSLVIGILNEEGTFLTEYILVYNNKNDQTKLIQKITGNSYNYLNNLQLINKCQSIYDYNNKEIGMIIKYESNDNNNNNNNIINNINNTNFNNNQYNNNNINYTNNSNNSNNTNITNNTNNNTNHNRNSKYVKLFTPPLNVTGIRPYFNNIPPYIGLDNIGAN